MSSDDAVSGRRRLPGAAEYMQALQHPDVCFTDPELASARPDLSPLGMPRAVSGNFTTVFPLTLADGRRFAARCFIRSPDDLELRYAALTGALAGIDAAWKASFEFQPEGIVVAGVAHPIVKMAWLDATPLVSYIQEHLWEDGVLLQAAVRFAGLVENVRHHGIAHGDLQHGNILVDASGNLRLIDYDGMYVPALAGRPGGELGHRNYQHPGRTARDWGPHLDHFSSWVIYTSLLALAIDPLLWGRLDGGDECLLFRARDFVEPQRSSAFACLEDRTDESLAQLSRALRELVTLPVAEVRPLPEIAELLPAMADAGAGRGDDPAVPPHGDGDGCLVGGDHLGAELARANAAVSELMRQRSAAEADQEKILAVRRAQEEHQDREAAELRAIDGELAASLGELSVEERELYRSEQDERAETARRLRREVFDEELSRHPIGRLYGSGITDRVRTSLAWAGVRSAADFVEVTAGRATGRGKPGAAVIVTRDGRQVRLESISAEAVRALITWRQWLESQAELKVPERVEHEEGRIRDRMSIRRQQLIEAEQRAHSAADERKRAVRDRYLGRHEQLADQLLAEQQEVASRLHRLDVELADARRGLAELEWRRERRHGERQPLLPLLPLLSRPAGDRTANGS